MVIHVLTYEAHAEMLCLSVGASHTLTLVEQTHVRLELAVCWLTALPSWHLRKILLILIPGPLTQVCCAAGGQRANWRCLLCLGTAPAACAWKTDLPARHSRTSGLW